MSKEFPGNILVTGGAGFIGSHVVDALLRRGARRLIVADNLSLGRRDNIAGHLRSGAAVLHRCDLASRKAANGLFSSHGPFDVVIHCAVEPLERSLEDPDGSFERNVAMTLNLIRGIRRQKKLQLLLHLSSSEVYGSGDGRRAMGEGYPLAPHTPYAASKAACDHLVQSMAITFGAPCVIARPFNNFGPRQNHGEYAALIPKIMKALAAGCTPVIHGSGAQTRDFVYAPDTARAILDLVKKAPRDGGVYNIASGRARSVTEITKALMGLYGAHGSVRRGPRRPGDVDHHRGDARRFLSAIDPSFRHTPFARALKATVEWYAAELGRG